MPDPAVIASETATVKADIASLKQCQVHYFNLSVTATAALLGLSRFWELAGIPQIGPLLPLVIVIPCWWIFFDKATTITRNVGYIIILESLSNGRSMRLNHYGFERSLALLRINEQVAAAALAIGAPGVSWSTMRRLLGLSMRHRYWTLNWLTFATLATICCVLAIVCPFGNPPSTTATNADAFPPHTPVGVWGLIAAATLAVLLSLIGTLRIVGNLMDGPIAYKNYGRIWGEILRNPPPPWLTWP